MRIVFISTLFVGIFSAISYLFWHNNWQIRLAPSASETYVRPDDIGTRVNLSGRLPIKAGKPLLIHFFNPECPCTRANIRHFRQLVKAYEGELNFAIVVLSHESYTEQEIQRKFDLKIPVSFDNSIAQACKVSSTPMAVLLDQESRLQYRGNYERTPHQRDKNANYARAAIESLIFDKPSRSYTRYAQTTRGCALPLCTK